MKRILLIPDEVADDLSKLIDLDVNTLSDLVNILSSPEAVPLDQLLRSRPDSVVTVEALLDHISVIKFLRDQKEGLDLTTDELIDNIKEYFREQDSPLGSKFEDLNVQQLFVRFFEKNENQLLSEKINILSKAMLDNFAELSSLCEIRPIFNLDKSRIIRYIPIIITKLSVTTADGDTNDLIFQMDEKALEQFKEFTEKTYQKLRLLNKVIEQLESSNV